MIISFLECLFVYEKLQFSQRHCVFLAEDLQKSYKTLVNSRAKVRTEILRVCNKLLFRRSTF